MAETGREGFNRVAIVNICLQMRSAQRQLALCEDEKRKGKGNAPMSMSGLQRGQASAELAWKVRFREI